MLGQIAAFGLPALLVPLADPSKLSYFLNLFALKRPYLSDVCSENKGAVFQEHLSGFLFLISLPFFNCRCR